MRTPTRRALVGTLATLGAAGLAGCNALFDDENEGAGDETRRGDGRWNGRGGTESRATEASEGTTTAPAFEQTVSVGNPNATAGYVTVVVESPDGETAFVESLELTSGERRPVVARLPGPGTYRVVAEAVDGGRGAFEWVADDRLDGFSLTLLREKFEFWRTAVCRDACRLVSEGENGSPLTGNGVGRWYAPAGVVLRNPASSARTAHVDVELDDRTVLAAAYDAPARTQVEIPVTYRTGEYRVRVRVGSGDEAVTAAWSVPDQPSLFVDLEERTTGCGLANSELGVLNADDEPHAVSVAVESDGEEVFARRWNLAPDERVDVVPVDASGRYGLRVRVDDRDPLYSSWWSCPPRGPAAVVVDATGDASVSQSRL
ncbi:hypothetical protein NDI76_13795 [Halogeometricum sp. S1BR25-6]|uniref:Ig-like domain-containing protein n=1 Tax=Halogeometricum salsisoli TaxID=2950536 RepID=A0ABU2GG92_9EURY|nr:hypothetical protein [Halogeometricum sp. S1BR25-6]MDS0299817.1 hypothetical protein [Halogeometricum sp. S1BR25-6]